MTAKSSKIFLGFIILLFIGQVSGQSFSLDQDISGDISSRPWDNDFSPDGSELAVIEDDSGDVLIFDTSDWSVKQTLDVNSGGANTGGLRAAQYSPDGSQIAIGGYGSSGGRGLYIYDTSTWNNVQLLNPTELKSAGYLQWSPDGSKIVYTGNPDNSGIDTIVYNTSDWSKLQTLDSGNTGNNGGHGVAWSPDGSKFAVGGSDGVITVFNASDYSTVTTLTEPTYVQDLDWRSAQLVSGGNSNDVYVYDTSDWSLSQTITDSSSRVFNVEYSENGEYLASGSEDEQTYLYHTSNYSQVSNSPLTDPSGIVFGISWKNDDTELATVSDSSGGHIYDTGITVNSAPSISNIEPSDGSTGVGTDVQLNATVSDSDGDSMSVSFYNASDGNQIGSTQTGISDGSTATVTWNGLNTGTNYSFYVNASDVTNTTQSSTVQFTTKNSPPSVNLESRNDGATVTNPVNFRYTPDCPSGSCTESALYTNQTIDYNLSYSSFEGILNIDDHDSEGFLTTLGNGSLAHIFRRSNGVDGNHVDNGGKIVGRIYDNSTETWGTVFTIFEDQYDDRNIHGGTTDNGTTVIFFRRYDSGGSGTVDVNYIYSEDNLNTFSNRQSITTNSVSPVGDMVEVPGKGYFMSFTDSGGDGHLYGRFSSHGKDWSSSEFTIADSTGESYDVNEADFSYVGEGRIIGLIRDGSNDQGDNYLQVTSSDKGSTWSNPSRTNIADQYWLTYPEIEYDQKNDLLIAMGGDRRSENSNGDLSSESLWIYKQNDIDEVFSDASAWTFVDSITRPQTSSSMSFYGYPDMQRYGDRYITVFTDRDNDGTNEDTDLYDFELNISDGSVNSGWGVVARSFDVGKDLVNSIEYDFQYYGLPSSFDWNIEVFQSDGQSGFASQNRTVNVEEVDTTSPADVEFTMNNVGSNAWEVLNEPSGLAGSGDNPNIDLEVGKRYKINNNGYPNHPLAFIDSNGNVLLSQSIQGSFEDDANVNWVDNGDSIVFTVTQGLKDKLDRYRCTIHVNNMVGDVDEPNSPPGVSFTAVTTDLKVDVSSTSSDGDGSISQYEWDWTNDGTFDATGQVATHTYSSGGTYTVNHRVTDNDGASLSLTRTFSVSSSNDDDGGGGGGGGTTDNTPPSTSDDWDVSGLLEKSQATVSLSATDAGVGVDRIEYQINGNGFTSVQGSSAQVDIFTEGNNTLEYYAVDNNGNQETTQTEYVAFKTSTDDGGDGGDGSQDTVSLQLESPQGDIDKDGATEINQVFDTNVDVNNSGTLELQISSESQTGFTAVDGKAIGINSDQSQQFSESFKVDYSNITDSKQVSEEISYRLEWQGDNGYSLASSVQKFRYINNIGGTGNNATGLFSGVASGLGVYLLLVLLLGVLALPLLIKVRLND